MEHENDEVRTLEKQMKKLRLKFKRAMDNQKPLRLTVNDVALLSIGILGEWIDDSIHDDA